MESRKRRIKQTVKVDSVKWVLVKFIEDGVISNALKLQDLVEEDTGKDGLEADLEEGDYCMAPYGDRLYRAKVLLCTEDKEKVYKDKVLLTEKDKRQTSKQAKQTKEDHMAKEIGTNQDSNKKGARKVQKKSTKNETEKSSDETKKAKKEALIQRKEKEESRKETLKHAQSYILQHVHVSDNTESSDVISSSPLTVPHPASPTYPPSSNIATSPSLSSVTHPSSSVPLPVPSMSPPPKTNSSSINSTSLSFTWSPSPSNTSTSMNGPSSISSMHSSPSNFILPVTCSSASVSQPACNSTYSSSYQSLSAPYLPPNYCIPMSSPYSFNNSLTPFNNVPSSYSTDQSSYSQLHTHNDFYNSTNSSVFTTPRPRYTESEALKHTSSMLRSSLSALEHVEGQCTDCDIKEREIESLNAALDAANGEISNLKQQLESRDQAKSAEEIVNHYVPIKGVKVDYSNYQIIPIGSDVPADMERLGEVTDVAVPKSWLMTIMAKCRGKGASFTIKKLFDGFFEPEHLAYKSASQILESSDIAKAIRIYAINKLKMRDVDFNLALNSKIQTSKRALKLQRRVAPE